MAKLRKPQISIKDEQFKYPISFICLQRENEISHILMPISTIKDYSSMTAKDQSRFLKDLFYEIKMIYLEANIVVPDHMRKTYHA